MNFDEALFIRALQERPADARKYADSFRPEWLKTAEYQPVLAKIFEFTKQHSIPPSINTLREMFLDEDKTAYELRFKDTLDKLEAREYTQDEIVYNIDRAKNIAISWSLNYKFKQPDFLAAMENFDGAEIIRDMQKWITSFEGSNEDIDFRIGDAVEDLIKTRGWNSTNDKIPTEIEFIDEWCGGGLRPRQLGILVAPTGAGKSMLLMNFAYRMALHGDKRVMFISNELSMGEITERFGSLIAQTDQDHVVHNPSVIRVELDKLTKFGIKEHLHLVEVNREISANDIESMIARNINLYGWAPEVIVLDYMERMKPLASGMDRQNTSGWYGEIAKDLIRMSKRTTTLVWTAAQTNRSGFNPEIEQNMAQVQGSVKHLQEAAAVIFMRQRKDLKLPSLENTNIRIMEFVTTKMRHAKGGDSAILVEADLSKMHITKKYHRPSEWDTVEEEDTGMKVSGGKKKRKKANDDTSSV